MSVVRNIFSALAPAVPVGALHELAGAPVVLPYYHMVSDETLPHVAPLYDYRSVRQFTADVDFFLQHFQPITLADLVAHVKNGTPLPRRAFYLTFDDGFREMAEVVAPILKAKGVSAAFFINSAFVDNRELCMHQKSGLLLSALASRPELGAKLKELLVRNGISGGDVAAMVKQVPYVRRAILDPAGALAGLDYSNFLARQRPYLTSDQIRGLLRDGFAVGGHSVDHPYYADLALDEQLRQTRDSVDFVCRNFAVNLRSFAFPHADTGVSRAFFERSYAGGALEISFGTGGLLPDAWPGHFQRFSMEKTTRDARPILAWQLARRRRYKAVDRSALPGPTTADRWVKK